MMLRAPTPWLQGASILQARAADLSSAAFQGWAASWHLNDPTVGIRNHANYPGLGGNAVGSTGASDQHGS